jgi:hypothetical protein
VLGRVEEEAALLLEVEEHRLSRDGGVAAENNAHALVLQARSLGAGFEAHAAKQTSSEKTSGRRDIGASILRWPRSSNRGAFVASSFVTRRVSSC